MKEQNGRNPPFMGGGVSRGEPAAAPSQTELGGRAAQVAELVEEGQLERAETLLEELEQASEGRSAPESLHDQHRHPPLPETPEGWGWARFALQAQRAVVGPKHYAVLQTQYDRAVVCQRLGNTGVAEKLFRSVRIPHFVCGCGARL